MGLKSQVKMSDHFDGVMRKYVKDSLEAVDAGNASDEQLQAAEWHYRLRTAAVEAANRQEEREIQAAEDEKRLILRNLEALEQLRAAGVSNQKGGCKRDKLNKKKPDGLPLLHRIDW